ncbi:MAG: ECF-type sigma factor [Phycisphaerales bacterium]|nr:ECF-type sigma factor [Phycisphaerales bacterium]
MNDQSSQTSSTNATHLLKQVSDGNAAAVEELLPLVYDELRARAGAYFRDQPGNHTLQPTALVHEVFLKLVRSPNGQWQDRAHFCAVAATAMRQILIDHARRRSTAQDAYGARSEASTLLKSSAHTSPVDLLALEDALNKLADLDPRQARIVELRFFGSLTIEETAKVLGVSTATIAKEWRRIRAWLILELGDEETP